jgi:hypothetical protein
MNSNEGYRLAYRWADDLANASGLPGRHNGPADAFRHIAGIAEATRRYGAMPAAMAGETNEQFGKDLPDALQMDRHNNNEVAIRIGRTARSSEEVARLAKAEIAAAIEHNGTGANGTAIWLEKARWNEVGRPRGSLVADFPPAWKDDAGLRVERLLTVPVETWSEDDVRAVQASRLYWQSGNPRQDEAFEKVKSWFQSSQTRRQNQLRTSHGPVTVDPYTRGDGTKVDGDTRSQPANR